MRGYAARASIAFSRLLNIVFQKISPVLAKYRVELRFQKSWAYLDKKNFNKVLEYWQKYRFLDEIEEIVYFRGSVVLDVGCGISTLLNHIEAKKKYCVDPLAEEYQKFFKYPDDLNVKAGRGENLPFARNSFDVAICSNVLDHTDDPGKTLDEIHRVLKPAGKLVLTLEIFTSPTKRRDAAHPHTITLRKLETLLSNFNVVFHKKSPWIGFKAFVTRERARYAGIKRMSIFWFASKNKACARVCGSHKHLS